MTSHPGNPRPGDIQHRMNTPRFPYPTNPMGVPTTHSQVAMETWMRSNPAFLQNAWQQQQQQQQQASAGEMSASSRRGSLVTTESVRMGHYASGHDSHVGSNPVTICGNSAMDNVTHKDSRSHSITLGLPRHHSAGMTLPPDPRGLQKHSGQPPTSLPMPSSIPTGYRGCYDNAVHAAQSAGSADASRHRHHSVIVAESRHNVPYPGVYVGQSQKTPDRTPSHPDQISPHARVAAGVQEATSMHRKEALTSNPYVTSSMLASMHSPGYHRPVADHSQGTSGVGGSGGTHSAFFRKVPTSVPTATTAQKYDVLSKHSQSIHRPDIAHHSEHTHHQDVMYARRQEALARASLSYRPDHKQGYLPAPRSAVAHDPARRSSYPMSTVAGMDAFQQQRRAMHAQHAQSSPDGHSATTHREHSRERSIPRSPSNPYIQHSSPPEPSSDQRQAVSNPYPEHPGMWPGTTPSRTNLHPEVVGRNTSMYPPRLDTVASKSKRPSPSVPADDAPIDLSVKKRKTDMDDPIIVDDLTQVSPEDYSHHQNPLYYGGAHLPRDYSHRALKRDQGRPTDAHVNSGGGYNVFNLNNSGKSSGEAGCDMSGMKVAHSASIGQGKAPVPQLLVAPPSRTLLNMLTSANFPKLMDNSDCVSITSEKDASGPQREAKNVSEYISHTISSAVKQDYVQPITRHENVGSHVQQWMNTSVGHHQMQGTGGTALHPGTGIPDRPPVSRHVTHRLQQEYPVAATNSKDQLKQLHAMDAAHFGNKQDSLPRYSISEDNQSRHQEYAKMMDPSVKFKPGEGALSQLESQLPIQQYMSNTGSSVGRSHRNESLPLPSHTTSRTGVQEHAPHKHHVPLSKTTKGKDGYEARHVMTPEMVYVATMYANQPSTAGSQAHEDKPHTPHPITTERGPKPAETGSCNTEGKEVDLTETSAKKFSYPMFKQPSSLKWSKQNSVLTAITGCIDREFRKLVQAELLDGEHVEGVDDKDSVDQVKPSAKEPACSLSIGETRSEDTKSLETKNLDAIVSKDDALLKAVKEGSPILSDILVHNLIDRARKDLPGATKDALEEYILRYLIDGTDPRNVRQATNKIIPIANVLPMIKSQKADASQGVVVKDESETDVPDVKPKLFETNLLCSDPSGEYARAPLWNNNSGEMCGGIQGEEDMHQCSNASSTSVVELTSVKDRDSVKGEETAGALALHFSTPKGRHKRMMFHGLHGMSLDSHSPHTPQTPTSSCSSDIKQEQKPLDGTSAVFGGESHTPYDEKFPLPTVAMSPTEMQQDEEEEEDGEDGDRVQAKKRPKKVSLKGKQVRTGKIGRPRKIMGPQRLAIKKRRSLSGEDMGKKTLKTRGRPPLGLARKKQERGRRSAVQTRSRAKQTRAKAKKEIPASTPRKSRYNKNAAYEEELRREEERKQIRRGRRKGSQRDLTPGDEISRDSTTDCENSSPETVRKGKFQLRGAVRAPRRKGGARRERQDKAAPSAGQAAIPALPGGPSPGPAPGTSPSDLRRQHHHIVCKETGETALHRAARLAKKDVALRLLSSPHVDANIRDHAGYTPLHESCVSGSLPIAVTLIARGADVNAKALDGTRPIHDAADHCRPELVRLLLAHGADPTIANYGGRTPLRLARADSVRELLQAYLCDVNGREDGARPWQVHHNVTNKECDSLDVLSGVPPDENESEANDVIFEMSSEQLPPTYNLRLETDKGRRNYHLVADVARHQNLSEEDFLLLNGDLTVCSVPRSQADVWMGVPTATETRTDEAACNLDKLVETVACPEKTTPQETSDSSKDNVDLVDSPSKQLCVQAAPQETLSQNQVVPMPLIDSLKRDYGPTDLSYLGNSTCVSSEQPCPDELKVGTADMRDSNSSTHASVDAAPEEMVNFVEVDTSLRQLFDIEEDAVEFHAASVLMEAPAVERRSRAIQAPLKAPPQCMESMNILKKPEPKGPTSVSSPDERSLEKNKELVEDEHCLMIPRKRYQHYLQHQQSQQESKGESPVAAVVAAPHELQQAGPQLAEPQHLGPQQEEKPHTGLQQTQPEHSEPPQAGPPKQGPQQQGTSQSKPIQATPIQAGPSQKGTPQARLQQQGPQPSGPQQQGSPHQGRPHQGPPHQGRPHQGPLHQGRPHQGSPQLEPAHQGRPHQGPPQQGRPHQGPPPQGRPHQGSPQLEPPQARSQKQGSQHAGPHQKRSPHAGPHQKGSPHAGPQQQGSPHAGPQQQGSPHAGPHRQWSPHAGSQQQGPLNAGPHQKGSPHAGQQQQGSPHAGPHQKGSPHAGPQQQGSPHAGPQQQGSPHAGPHRQWSPHAGPQQQGPLNAGPQQQGSPHAGPQQQGSPHAGPQQQGSPHAGPQQQGPLNAGPQQQWSHHAGPHQQGPPHAGPQQQGSPHAGPQQQGQQHRAQQIGPKQIKQQQSEPQQIHNTGPHQAGPLQAGSEQEGLQQTGLQQRGLHHSEPHHATTGPQQLPPKHWEHSKYVGQQHQLHHQDRKHNEPRHPADSKHHQHQRDLTRSRHHDPTLKKHHQLLHEVFNTSAVSSRANAEELNDVTKSADVNIKKGNNTGTCEDDVIIIECDNNTKVANYAIRSARGCHRRGQDIFGGPGQAYGSRSAPHHAEATMKVCQTSNIPPAVTSNPRADVAMSISSSSNRPYGVPQWGSTHTAHTDSHVSAQMSAQRPLFNHRPPFNHCQQPHHPSPAHFSSPAQHPSPNLHPAPVQHPPTAQHPSAQHSSTGQHPSAQHSSTGQHPSAQHSSTGQHPSAQHSSTGQHSSAQHSSTGQHPSAQHSSTGQHPSAQHPAASQHPAAAHHLSSSQHPTVAQHPAVAQHPTVGQHPTPGQYPAIAQRPSTTQQPSAHQRSSTAKQPPQYSPTTQQPPAAHRPPANPRPPMAHRSPIAHRPPTTQCPPPIQQPSSSQFQPATQYPSNARLQPASQRAPFYPAPRPTTNMPPSEHKPSPTNVQPILLQLHSMTDGALVHSVAIETDPAKLFGMKSKDVVKPQMSTNNSENCSTSPSLMPRASHSANTIRQGNMMSLQTLGASSSGTVGLHGEPVGHGQMEGSVHASSCAAADVGKKEKTLTGSASSHSVPHMRGSSVQAIGGPQSASSGSYPRIQGVAADANTLIATPHTAAYSHCAPRGTAVSYNSPNPVPQVSPANLPPSAGCRPPPPPTGKTRDHTDPQTRHRYAPYPAHITQPRPLGQAYSHASHPNHGRSHVPPTPAGHRHPSKSHNPSTNPLTIDLLVSGPSVSPGVPAREAPSTAPPVSTNQQRSACPSSTSAQSISTPSQMSMAHTSTIPHLVTLPNTVPSSASQLSLSPSQTQNSNASTVPVTSLSSVAPTHPPATRSPTLSHPPTTSLVTKSNSNPGETRCDSHGDDFNPEFELGPLFIDTDEEDADEDADSDATIIDQNIDIAEKSKPEVLPSPSAQLSALDLPSCDKSQPPSPMVVCPSEAQSVKHMPYSPPSSNDSPSTDLRKQSPVSMSPVSHTDVKDCSENAQASLQSANGIVAVIPSDQPNAKSPAEPKEVSIEASSDKPCTSPSPSSVMDSEADSPPRDLAPEVTPLCEDIKVAATTEANCEAAPKSPITIAGIASDEKASVLFESGGNLVNEEKADDECVSPAKHVEADISSPGANNTEFVETGENSEISGRGAGAQGSPDPTLPLLEKVDGETAKEVPQVIEKEVDNQFDDREMPDLTMCAF